ncbi:MAG: UDP-N-acetylglucosamine 2-epimerase (non-hydrolyzing) [Candidatus Omnitrophica bacterium]|nr:UDP-N-acetylglucosamine 2-epimerase (non-hydrolyzing) [Candidatus Omnitrophota bacterium]
MKQRNRYIIACIATFLIMTMTVSYNSFALTEYFSLSTQTNFSTSRTTFRGTNLQDELKNQADLILSLLNIAEYLLGSTEKGIRSLPYRWFLDVMLQELGSNIDQIDIQRVYVNDNVVEVRFENKQRTILARIAPNKDLGGNSLPGKVLYESQDWTIKLEPERYESISQALKAKKDTKFCFVIGTRPEIIKVWPLIRYCRENKIQYKLIHTGQHYDANMSDDFFKGLNIPAPDYVLSNFSKGKQREQVIAQMSEEVENILRIEKPTHVFVQGDTNSSYAGALGAKRNKIVLCHVEAGLRSFDRSMPEEINREAIDRLADINFCPSENNADNLIREGIGPELLVREMYVTGNTIVDAVNLGVKTRRDSRLSDWTKKFGIEEGKYSLLTLHRNAMVEDVVLLRETIENVAKVSGEYGLPVLFLCHPRTRKVIEENNISLPYNIVLQNPVSDYFEMIRLEEMASIVFTDSGGVMEEACILKVPTIVLRKNSERSEALDIGAAMLTGENIDDLRLAVKEMLSHERTWDTPFGDGRAAEVIIKKTLGVVDAGIKVSSQNVNKKTTERLVWGRAENVVDNMQNDSDPAWMKSREQRLNNEEMEAIAAKIRLEILRMWKVMRGPLSGNMSMVELYTSFFMNVLNSEAYTTGDPRRARIAPKGTAAFAVYAAAGFAGIISPAKLQNFSRKYFEPVTYRKVIGDISNYKMGMSFEQGIGLALAGKYKKEEFPVIVFLADGGLQPGLDHPAKFAAQMALDNLALVIDVNEMQSNYFISDVDPTLARDDKGTLARQKMIWEGYGWDVLEIDGHDFDQIENAYRKIGRGDKPLVILANTIKGKGIKTIEGKLGYNHNIDDINELVAAEKEISLVLQEHVLEGRKVTYPEEFQERAEGNARAPLIIPEFKGVQGNLLTDNFKGWMKEFLALNNSAVVINTDSPVPFDIKTPILSPATHSQYIFAGINERFALNLSAGMTQEGIWPIYIGPASHMPVTAEDWKFIAMDKQPVLIVSVNSGSTTSHWGAPHLVYEDIDAFNTPGSTVFQPTSSGDVDLILENIYREPDKYMPAYLRLSGVEGVVPPKDIFGSSSQREKIFKEGFYVMGSLITGDSNTADHVTIISSGVAMVEALEAGRLLSLANIPYKVINVFNLSHLNKESLFSVVKGKGPIITIMDAKPDSLAGLIHRTLPAEKGRVVALGVSDWGGTVPVSEIFKNNGMDAKNIYRIAMEERNGSLSEAEQTAMEWMRHSGIQNNSKSNLINGSINGVYDFDTKGYPFIYSEITGYGTSFFSDYYEDIHDTELLGKATAAADWIIQCAMQESGGVRTRQGLSDEYYEDKYAFENNSLFTFDTGICLKGLMDLYKKTHNSRYLDAAVRMGRFIISAQREQGGIHFAYNATAGRYEEEELTHWSRQTGSYHAKIVGGLLDLYDITGENDYKACVENICDNSLKYQHEDGRFIVMKGTDRTELHPHCYTAEGLFEAGRRLQRADYLRASAKAMEWALSNQNNNGGIAWAFNEGDHEGIKAERSDGLAQVLRLSVRLLGIGEMEDKYIPALGRLVDRLMEFQIKEGSQKGGFVFGKKEDGWEHFTCCSWSTMFAYEAIREYRIFLNAQGERNKGQSLYGFEVKAFEQIETDADYPGLEQTEDEIVISVISAQLRDIISDNNDLQTSLLNMSLDFRHEKIIKLMKRLISLLKTDIGKEHDAVFGMVNERGDISDIKRAIRVLNKHYYGNDTISKVLALFSQSIVEIEVDSVLSNIIVLARKADRGGTNLILGIDFNWIPDLDKEGVTKNAINPLLTRIRLLDKKLKAMGLNKVVVIHGSGDELADNIGKEVPLGKGDYSNVIVLGPKNMLKKDSFNYLRGNTARKGAFFTCIDSAEPVSKTSADAEYYITEVLEMLNIALNFAMGKDITIHSMVNMETSDIANRLIMLMPRPERVKYEEFINENKSRNEFLLSV